MLYLCVQRMGSVLKIRQRAEGRGQKAEDEEKFSFLCCECSLMVPNLKIGVREEDFHYFVVRSTRMVSKYK